MGFFGDQNERRAKEYAFQARKAKEGGHAIFTARLDSRIDQHALPGSIDRWTDIIEAIELGGWILEHWEVCLDRNNRPEAYPIFRID